jgi:hypothetical protein
VSEPYIGKGISGAKQVVHNIANRFSGDRASFLGHPARKELKLTSTRGNIFYPDQPKAYSSDSSPSSDDSQVTTLDRQFLDKPRPFQPNLDMVSSNTSGSIFKRTSILHPEEKNPQREFFDICTRPMPGVGEMAMTKISRKFVKAPPSGAGIGEGVFDVTRVPLSRLVRSSSSVKDYSSSHSPNDSNQSGEEQVMHWLVTHLPEIQEEDAVIYFSSLMNDGFDCDESLSEILAEDLHFMTEEHRVALLLSLQKSTVVVGPTD